MAKLQAGYGEKVITPPMGVELSGYGFYLKRKAESVLDDLKARALYLDDGGRRIMLISCDLVGLTVSVSDGIRGAVSKAAGIPTANIMLACTHTHTGPATMPLPGIGEIDPGYMKSLPDAIVAAASSAVADAAPAEFSYSFEALEPLGYNRRDGSFEGIDPYLKIAYFEHGSAGGDILLLSYACHAVILGRATRVSADWPGAAVRAVEATGRRAIFFQGFCGDIDPVTQLNRWGEGTADDLALYGRIVSDRAAKSRRYAAEPVASGHSGAEAGAGGGAGGGALLRITERRVRIPLSVPPKKKIGRMAALFLEKNSGFPMAERFAEEWKKTALESHEALAARPYVEGVPIQAVGIGGLEIIGLPGEAFSLFGTSLKESYPTLVPVGYANGDIGYFPTRGAFEDPGDYACYCAPMFYTVFPFTPDIEDILLRASRDVLDDLKEQSPAPS